MKTCRILLALGGVTGITIKEYEDTIIPNVDDTIVIPLEEDNSGSYLVKRRVFIFKQYWIIYLDKII